MSIHCYIQVTETFRTANEGTVNGCNILRTAQATDGRIVVSMNTVNEFPELFQDRQRFTAHWLSPEDFPSNNEIN